MVVVNTGHTPALGVRCAMRLKILAYPLADDFDLNLPVPETDEAAYLFPQQRLSFRANLDAMLTDNELHAIKTAATPKMVVYGIAKYKDIFDVEHTTTFCQHMAWDVKGIVSSFNEPRHNEAT